MKYLLLTLVVAIVVAAQPTPAPELGYGMDLLDSKLKLPIIDVLGVLTSPNATYRGEIVTGRNETLSIYDLRSTVLKSVKEVKDLTAISASAHAGFGPIKGSFKASKEWFHDRMTSSDSRIARTYAYAKESEHSVVYSVAPLTEGFENQVKLILTLVEHNTNRSLTRARAEACNLISTYGTSVIYQVSLGGMLIKDNVHNVESWNNYCTEALSIAASAAYAGLFGMSAKYSHSGTDMGSYYNSLLETKVHTKGGLPWTSELQVDAWINSISTYPAVIDKSVVPITDFIVPERFHNATELTVQRARDLVFRELQHYAKVNTRYGCMDPGSPHFDPHANVDRNCGPSERNFTFGGMIQNSNCDNFHIQNEISQGDMCPRNFTKYSLVDIPIPVERELVCHRECHHHWIFFKKCHSVCQWSQKHPACTVTPSVCEALKGHTATDGMFFGGMYSEQRVNPVTGAMRCPTGFTDTLMFQTDWNGHGIHVCYAPFDERLGNTGIQYGGMFTCRAGNPLAGGQMICPRGFIRHSMGYVGKCEVSFCMHMSGMIGHMPIIPPCAGDKPPPFVDLYPLNGDDWEGPLLPLNMTSPVLFEQQYYDITGEEKHHSHHHRDNAKPWIASFSVVLSMYVLTVGIIATAIIVVLIRRRKHRRIATGAYRDTHVSDQEPDETTPITGAINDDAV